MVKRTIKMLNKLYKSTKPYISQLMSVNKYRKQTTNDIITALEKTFQGHGYYERTIDNKAML